MKTPTELDWAQLAAYIDGEGCISITVAKPQIRQKHRQHGLSVSISNADKRLLEWCAFTFGGRIASRLPREGWSVMHTWWLKGSEAEKILTCCLPYFKIKREQSEIALRFRETYHNRGGYSEWSQGRPRSVELLQKRDTLREEMIAEKRKFSKKAGRGKPVLVTY